MKLVQEQTKEILRVIKNKLSVHAKIRCQQRGMRNDVIDSILANADSFRCRGRGIEANWISEAGLKKMGPYTPEGASTDRCRNVVVLVSSEDRIVTAGRFENTRRWRKSV